MKFYQLCLFLQLTLYFYQLVKSENDKKINSFSNVTCDRSSDFSCWVYGNHYRNTASDLCALGSSGCLWKAPELINVTAENYETQKWMLSMDPKRIVAYIIPGETPNDTPQPIRMYQDEHDRLEVTASLFKDTVSKYGDVAIIIPSGGNAHPRDPLTPYNEAYQMKQILNREYGIPTSRIIIDSYAQHSTTNLRNTGRFMMQMGIDNATIVADYSQSFYFAHDWLYFRERCEKELGYVVGYLDYISLLTTFFQPFSDCWRKGTDLLDP